MCALAGGEGVDAADGEGAVGGDLFFALQRDGGAGEALAVSEIAAVGVALPVAPFFGFAGGGVFGVADDPWLMVVAARAGDRFNIREESAVAGEMAGFEVAFLGVVADETLIVVAAVDVGAVRSETVGGHAPMVGGAEWFHVGGDVEGGH